MVRSSADRPAISTGPALMIPAGYPRDLPSALLRAARDFGAAGVVEIGPDGRETKLDFPTLLELAARILAGLRANGVRAGDPAVVHCTEPVGFFAAFWACTLGGIRPLLMAPSLEGDRTESGRERLRTVTDLLGWTVLIGRPSDLPDDLGLPVLDPDALAGHEPTNEFHRPAADDVAVLMLSSGTTGAPKIVQLTHRGLVEFAAGTPAMLPVRPGQTTLNWLPLDQSGAFLLYHLLPVFTGCTNIHVNTRWVLDDPLRWLDLMDQHRVNHSWSPNFGYRLATQAIAGEPDRHWDLSALRSLVSGGEQITVPVMSEFLRLTNRFGVVPETFVAAWGMTETVTGITFARPGLTPNVHRVRVPPTGVVEWVDQRPSSGKVAVARPGKPRTEAPGVLSLVSVGAPAPGTTVRIVAPNGAVLPEGRIGQLQVASARVTPGYLGNLEADRTAFPVGNWPARKWLATGDQGFITGGQVVITGRDSERIIMSGKLYYAHDIEAVAATVVGAEHGLVAACGVADTEAGTDRLVVFYALTPDSVPGMDQAIRSLIQSRLQLAAEVVGVPRRDFPTTPGGKVLRPLLKQRWLDGTLETPPHPHIEPAGATPFSGPTGQGPESATAHTQTTPSDEDPTERTTELPVIRLAWQRTLANSIPTPPQRPTQLLTPPNPDTELTPEPTAQTTPAEPDQPEAPAADDTSPAAEHPEASETPAAAEQPTSEPATQPTPVESDEPEAPAAAEHSEAAETPAAEQPTSEPATQVTPAETDDVAAPAADETSAAAQHPDAVDTPAAEQPTAEPATQSTPVESDEVAAAIAVQPQPAESPAATAEHPAAQADSAQVDAEEQPDAAEPTEDADAAVEQPASPEPARAEQPTAEPAAQTTPAEPDEDAAPAGADETPAETSNPELSSEAGAPAAEQPETPAPAVPNAAVDSADGAAPAVAEQPTPVELTEDADPAVDQPASAEPTRAEQPRVEPAAQVSPAEPDEDAASTAAQSDAAEPALAEHPAAEPTAQATPAEPDKVVPAAADETSTTGPDTELSSTSVTHPTAPEPAAVPEPDAEQSEPADPGAAEEPAVEPQPVEVPVARVEPVEVAQPAHTDESAAAPESDAEDVAAAEPAAQPAAEPSGALDAHADPAEAAEVAVPAAAQSEAGEPALAEQPTAESSAASGAQGIPAEAGEVAAPAADETLAKAPNAELPPGTDEPEAPAAVQAEAVEPALADEATAESSVASDAQGTPAEAGEVAATAADETPAKAANAELPPGTDEPEAPAAVQAEAVEAGPAEQLESVGADVVSESVEVATPAVAQAEAVEPALADEATAESSAASGEQADPAEAGEVAAFVADESEAVEPALVERPESVGLDGVQPVAAPAVAQAEAVELAVGLEGVRPAEVAAAAVAARSEGVEVAEVAVERPESVEPAAAEERAVEPEAVVGSDAQVEQPEVGEPESFDEPVDPEQAASELVDAEAAGVVGPEVAEVGEAAVEQSEAGASAPAEESSSEPSLETQAKSVDGDVAASAAQPVVADGAPDAEVELAAAGSEEQAKVAGAVGRGLAAVGALVAEPGGKVAGQAGRGGKGAVDGVAVVGLAGRFPGAETLEVFWDNLVGGVESVGPAGGVLDDVESFDAKFFGLSDREAELMDPAQRLFLEVCHQALEHGGYGGTTNRVGVFAGSGMNLYGRRPQPRDSLAARVAYRLGLTGPAIGVQSAWSSSLVAVHLACQALRSGDADLALAGAAAVQVPQATGPEPSEVLSPSGHARAFDAAADGTVGGNGVAAVLLKRLDQAVADGDTVYAVIRGTAVSSEDAPGGNQADLIERALQRAGFAAESLSYLEANAIGSGPADAAEVRALSAALRRHTDKVGFCTIGSVKPNIGHLDSAAGMAGLIKTILMLQHRMLVPTINYRKPNPELGLDGSPFTIGTKARDWESGTTLRAGVSALDEGGTNAHVILEEPPRQVRRGDDGPVVLPLSAPDPDALTDLVELYRTDLGHGTGHRLIDLAGTTALGRSAHRHRIAVAGGTEAELVDALGSAQATEAPRGGPGALGYAFTGQGAARRGMAAGLAARFPVFRSVLDECDRVYAEETGGSLLELLLTPAGSDGVWPTETAQPALFAFELALARLWQSFGVQPALVVGHSVGEYAALCVAEALSPADGVRLTAKRGELMQRGTAPGAMVSVRADADRVRELARTSGVEIAAGNGPQSYVLSGSEVIVGQLAAQLDQLQVAYQRLDVDRAFHSSLVEPILSDFAEIVRGITLKPLRTPMVSSWSGELLESGTVLDSEYLVGQLRQPVLFGDAVEAVTAAGCRRFLELGPDAVLSPAGRRIAPNSTWIPAQRLGQDPVLATMNGLAELYEQGQEINWSKVYAFSGRVPLPTYPFRRVHHSIETPAATTAAAPEGRSQVSAFERAARAQAVGSTAAVKRIPLDPPAEVAEIETADEQLDEESPFALPAETHSVDADYLAQAGSLSGDEVSAERYRDALDAVLDLTCEELRLDPYDLTVDHTFAELGATPESMAPVIDQINERFTVELTPGELFGAFTTPHKLATAVAVQTARADAEEEVAESNEEPETPVVEAVSVPVVELAVAEVGVDTDDPRTALAVLGSGLAELAAKVDEAAAATGAAELPGSGMAALMSQQLRVAGQLVEGVTKLMSEQLALLNEVQTTQPAVPVDEEVAEGNEMPEGDQAADDMIDDPGAPVAVVDVPDDELPGLVDEDPRERELRRVVVEQEVAPSVAGWRRDLGYWQVALAGAEPLVLPADGVRTGKVASVKLELTDELGDEVFVFSRERKVSPLMTMLAAVGTVLGRFAAQDDVTIGSALIRPQGDTSAAPRRALPIRIDLSGEPDLGELAHRVRDVTTGAFEHAGTDLAILERDPLFQVLVEFEDGDDELPEPLDLRLRLTHHGAGITCTADYREGLLHRATIDRLLNYLQAVLHRATNEPRLRLPQLMQPIASDLEALRRLEGDLEPVGPIGRSRRDAVVAGELSGLHTLFEQQVARTPDAVALAQGNRELTYAELDRRANAVAWQLADLGVKPGQIVAIRVARGTELVVAVLAVLKSGAAYLPLDPGVPESRWAFMVNDAAAVALVGDDAALADRLGLTLVPVAAVDGDPRARQAPPVQAAADDIAYCIYISGSNGNPKGVLVPHRGPVNLVRHYLRTRSSLRTLQWTSFGFDVHVQEMFTALASGAGLVLIGEDDRYDPDAVIAALRDHQVERLFMTFSPLTALLATMRRLPELPALREIVAGGEAMVLTHKVREFLDAHPDCRLFNEYGPVEASIVTTIHEVDPAEDRPSIGRPVDGVAVRLLDQALRPVPVGGVGEIHLGGAAVAQGYLGRPEETELMFVPDPVHPGGRLYRTRDLGRWRPDGTLEYLGRADDQVKIRGHRVEPGETEHVLADQPGVIDAVVVANNDPAGDTCLIGYVVLEDSDPAVLARLMLDLGKELPIYLVPADLIPIEELPLDDNGRLDRGRLPEPEWLRP
ncbi:non-ribosomal peptide synthetase/type I polyketide synthase [Kribbella sandramycini]|uniref:non-ribosomal peptide synthetase/type I polyketide synthase n=1 Tax=Kribbella sandramycini TaxID=60450 RepID=UPI0031CF3E5E